MNPSVAAVDSSDGWFSQLLQPIASFIPQLGSISIAIALASSLTGCILYILVARGKTEYLSAARISARLMIFTICLAAASLLVLIFTYRFDVNYVYEHASRSLSKPILFAVFYASQEGSFMLWALLSSIVAIFLMPYARRQRYEPHVMSVFLSILVFLSVMLLVKSPFISLSAAHPGEVPLGFIPPDGKGLNPSLENLWIAIHPPMLFAGFTLIAVPFCFAVAGLIKRDYQGWVTTSLPWTLGAGMILGFGIILGGFWAYETLGWGGFWAWDPVENASFMPWLLTVAAFHTMLSQKRSGGLVKMNILMTLLAFALVLYASFLTRSGVLGDFSVHSFVSPGNDVFRLLVVSLVLFVGGSFAIYFSRFRDMTKRNAEYKMLSRETGLSIGSAIVGASALVIFIGTSAPLVKKSVDISFYGNLHIPIAIALMLVNGLSLLLKWKQSSMSELLKKSAISLGLALIVTIGLFAIGLHDISYLAIIAASLFSLFVNIEMAWGFLRGKMNFVIVRDSSAAAKIFSALKWAVSFGIIGILIASRGDYYKFGDAIVDGGLYWLTFTAGLIFTFLAIGAIRLKFDTRYIGAYVAHAGLAIFILGVVASSHYEEKQSLELIQGVEQTAFGNYKLTYAGHDFTEPARYHMFINVNDKDGNVATANPVMFQSAFDNFKSWNVEPSVLKYVSKDLYFTVKGTEPLGGPPKDSLVKGQTVSTFGGKFDLTFVDFDFPPEERAKMVTQKAFRVKANLIAKATDDPNAKEVPMTISVTRKLSSDEATMEDFKIPGTKLHVQLAELRPNLEDRAKSKIIILTRDEDNPPPPLKEKIYVDAFIKPYINLVWGGVIILTIGFCFSMLRRRREALTAIEKAESAFEKVKGLRAQKDGLHNPIASEGYVPRLVKKQKA